FDSLKVTLERPNQPEKLVIAIDKFAAVMKATFAGTPPASASQAPMPALAAVHQLDAKPLMTCGRVYSDDFDLNDLKIDSAVDTPAPGKKVAKLLIDGTLKGPHKGKVHIVISLDFAAKPKLPVGLEVSFDQIDISGAVAKTIPTMLPVLGGSSVSGESMK